MIRLISGTAILLTVAAYVVFKHRGRLAAVSSAVLEAGKEAWLSYPGIHVAEIVVVTKDETKGTIVETK